MSRDHKKEGRPIEATPQTSVRPHPHEDRDRQYEDNENGENVKETNVECVEDANER